MTREEWLKKAVRSMRPLLRVAGVRLPRLQPVGYRPVLV